MKTDFLSSTAGEVEHPATSIRGRASGKSIRERILRIGRLPIAVEPWRKCSTAPARRRSTFVNGTAIPPRGVVGQVHDISEQKPLFWLFATPFLG
jgi:hypothetical protein